MRTNLKFAVLTLVCACSFTEGMSDKSSLGSITIALLVLIGVGVSLLFDATTDEEKVKELQDKLRNEELLRKSEQERYETIIGMKESFIAKLEKAIDDMLEEVQGATKEE